MKINGVNGANAHVGIMGAMNTNDSFSKNIQSQIERKQEELHEISSDKEMPLEEKMKKRQEIQQEINVLQQQLRQHEIEQRREGMNGSGKQEKGISMEEMLGGNRKNVKSRNNMSGTSKQGSQNISSATMSAMISADASLKQAGAQGSMAVQIKGKANVLESEIKMDKGRGASTEKKEAELEDLQEKAATATKAQMSELSDANKVMEDAVKESADSRGGENSSTVKKTADKIADKKDNKTDDKTNNEINDKTDNKINDKINNKTVDKETSDKNMADTDNKDNIESVAAQAVQYTSVDIYL